MEFVLALVVAIIGGALSASLPTLHKDVPIQEQDAFEAIDRSSDPIGDILTEQDKSDANDKSSNPTGSANARDALVQSIDLLDITIDALSNLKTLKDAQKPEVETTVERRDGKSEGQLEQLDALDSRLDTKASEKVRRSVLDDVKQLLETKFSALLEDEMQWRSGVLQRRPKPKIATKPPRILEKKKLRKGKTSQDDKSNVIKILTDGTLQDSSDIALRNIVDQLLKEDEDKSARNDNFENNQSNGNSIEESFNDIISDLINKEDQAINSNINQVDTNEEGSDTEEVLKNLDLDEILRPVLKELSDSVGQESVSGRKTIADNLKANTETNNNERNIQRQEKGITYEQPSKLEKHVEKTPKNKYDVQNNGYIDDDVQGVKGIDTDEHVLQSESNNDEQNYFDEKPREEVIPKSSHEKLKKHQYNNYRRSQQYHHNNNQNISRLGDYKTKEVNNHNETPITRISKIVTKDLIELSQPKLKVQNYNKSSDSKIAHIRAQSKEKTHQENNNHIDTIHTENTIILKNTEKKQKNTNNNNVTGHEDNISDDENDSEISSDKNTNSVNEETIVTEEEENLSTETRSGYKEENSVTHIDEIADEADLNESETINPIEENITLENDDVTDHSMYVETSEDENVSAQVIATAEKNYTNEITDNSANAETNEIENVNVLENTTVDKNNAVVDNDIEDRIDKVEDETERCDLKQDDRRKLENLGNVGSNSLRDLLNNENIVQSYSFSITFTPK